ncbi:hypothetical protein U1Q18_025122 [Sarracenia purpurea var. burkii]
MSLILANCYKQDRSGETLLGHFARTGGKCRSFWLISRDYTEFQENSCPIVRRWPSTGPHNALCPLEGPRHAQEFAEESANEFQVDLPSSPKTRLKGSLANLKERVFGLGQSCGHSQGQDWEDVVTELKLELEDISGRLKMLMRTMGNVPVDSFFESSKAPVPKLSSTEMYTFRPFKVHLLIPLP